MGPWTGQTGKGVLMEFLVQAILVLAYLSGFVLLPLLVARLSYRWELRRTLERASEKPGEWTMDLSQDRPGWLAICSVMTWFMLGIVLLGFPWLCAIPIFVLSILFTAVRFGRLDGDFEEPKAASCRFYQLEPAIFGERLMKTLDQNGVDFRYLKAEKQGWLWPPRATVWIEIIETQETGPPPGQRRGFDSHPRQREKRILIYYYFGFLELDGLRLTMLSVVFYDATYSMFNPLYDGSIRKRFLDLVDENIKEVYRQPLV